MWLFNLLAGLLLVVMMAVLSREDETQSRAEEDVSSDDKVQARE